MRCGRLRRLRPGSWLAALLAPIGYVLQDVVADAMTVEAVPRFDDDGHPLGASERKPMHRPCRRWGGSRSSAAAWPCPS